ncbi:hypothetical protein J2Y02_003719 [Neobacillus drentensis]|nr:hypothetical protein [Neobacillus drentensis]MDR7239087.1 hypothetical protein [Neobacillus drentensis]
MQPAVTHVALIGFVSGCIDSYCFKRTNRSTLSAPVTVLGLEEDDTIPCFTDAIPAAYGHTCRCLAVVAGHGKMYFIQSMVSENG